MLFRFILFLVTIFFSLASHANVVGTDAQNFNPTTSGLDYVTVHSSETLEPGIFNVGLFLNSAVNSLPRLQALDDSQKLRFRDSLLMTDLSFGLGILKNWDVGVSFPFLLKQETTNAQGSRLEFANTGLTEVRLNTKFRLWAGGDSGVAAILSTNFSNIENNPFTGQDPKPTVNIEIAGDRTFGKWAMAANLGYRIRNPGDPVPGSIVAPLKNQWIGSLATSYRIDAWRVKVISEIFGSLPASGQDKNGDLALRSAEWLVGAKYDVSTSMAVHAGVGTELIAGQASPDFRSYVGLNYNMGPLWSESRGMVRVSGDERPERYRVSDILFDVNSDVIPPQSMASLEALAIELRKGFRKLRIEGHTDSVGSSEYNLDLSQRRAEAIKKVLIEKYKISGAMIETIGYGEDRPIADNGNYQGRKTNRRVEFEILR